MYSISKNRSWILLSVILAIGALLRFYHLDTYSIFFDEKSTMVVSQGIVLEGANQKAVFTQPSFTPSDFWEPKSVADYYEAMTRSDIGNSPFYYLLLHLWMDVFGLSDFSARALSVVFSLLIIGLTFLFARRFFSVNTALIAAAIVAIEPFFIAYSHQARNYSLTFFLALLSTYFLLRIVEDEQDITRKRRNYGPYAGYLIASFLCPLSHFLTVSVFLAQGIYVLFFLKARKWLPLAVTVVLAMSGICWWLVYGGGQWTLHSLDHQAKEYRRVAELMPYDNPYGIILPATLGNVFVKSLPIFSDLLIFANGLADALSGKKNLIVSLFVGFSITGLYHFRGFRALSLTVRSLLLAALSIGPVFYYSESKAQFVVLSVAVLLLSFLPRIHRKASERKKRRLWLLYIMATVPTLFLILFAFKSGHTYGLTQRYSGFSFPYVICWIGLLLQYVGRMKLPEFRVLIGIVLLMQAGFVGIRLTEFYGDRSVKYGYFAEPRDPNPYYAAAQRIQLLYQPGDTVFYGAPPIRIFNEMDRTFLPYSVQDAQLTNLYLPKDAAYVQVMDTIRIDKIILKQKVTGDLLELADLTDKRY